MALTWGSATTSESPDRRLRFCGLGCCRLRGHGPKLSVFHGGCYPCPSSRRSSYAQRPQGPSFGHSQWDASAALRPQAAMRQLLRLTWRVRAAQDGIAGTRIRSCACGEPVDRRHRDPEHRREAPAARAQCAGGSTPFETPSAAPSARRLRDFETLLSVSNPCCPTPLEGLGNKVSKVRQRRKNSKLSRVASRKVSKRVPSGTACGVLGRKQCFK